MASLAAHGSTATILPLLERLKGDGYGGSSVDSLDALFSVAQTDAFVVHCVDRVPPALQRLPQALAGKLILLVEQATTATEADLLAFKTTLAAMVVKQAALAIEEMAVAVSKVLSRKALGLERYLPGTPPVERVVLTQSIQRGQALIALDQYVGGLGLDSRRVAQVLTIADELITNAFYHAPVDGIGGHPFSHVSRMDLIQCRPNHAIELAFSRSEGLVAVSVRDRYGSLEQPQLRSHLAKAVTNPTANFKVTGGGGGARIGLITAVRAASQLVFNVIPRELTECIGIVETSGTYRQFLEPGKMVQLFCLPGAAVPPPV